MFRGNLLESPYNTIKWTIVMLDMELKPLKQSNKPEHRIPAWMSMGLN